MLHTVAEKQQQEARGVASNRTWVGGLGAAWRTARTSEDRRSAGSALTLQQGQEQQEGASDSTAAGTAGQDLPREKLWTILY
jgi:hypothetical protein